jgi:hypothetical protein
MTSENFIYKLSQGIEVDLPAGHGDSETYHEIEFKAPSYQCISEAIKIQQIITRAFLSADLQRLTQQIQKLNQDQIQEIQKNKVPWQENLDSIKMIAFLSNENFSEVIKIFMKLCPSVAIFDDDKGGKGNIKVKEKHLSKLPYNEIIDIVCAYIANFLMPSFF